MDAVQVAEEDNMADKEDKEKSGQREDFFLMGGDKEKARIRVGDIDVELPIEQGKLITEERKADKDKAATFVTDKAEFDALKSKSDDEIKRACILAANPEVKLDEKSETYIDAMFDLLQPQHEDTMSRQGKALLGARSQNRDDGREILTERINKAIDTTDALHRSAVPGGMTVDGKTGSRDDQLHG